MSRVDGLERDLISWFAESTSPRDPDLTEDVLWVTARTRQRSPWTVAERWLPPSVLTLGRRSFGLVPWRTVALLALLVVVAVGVAAISVASRPRLPAPFGLAANGLVAYAQNGDIYAVDPITGLRQGLAVGPDNDSEPRWSLDGTRVAFIRTEGTAAYPVTSTSIVIVDARTHEVVAVSGPFAYLDTDTLSWAPDGRSLAIGSVVGNSMRLTLVDAATGTKTRLAVDYAQLDVYWRPPDGRQLLFLGASGTEHTLFVVDVVDGSVTKIASPGVVGGVLRPSGWTPDGRRVIYTTQDVADGPPRTHVVDIATGAEVVVDAGFAHVSNDGNRIVAIDDDGRMCVADIGGGPCQRVGTPEQTYAGTTAAGVSWSPDDAWILSRSPDIIGKSSLVDPDDIAHVQPSWLNDGGESWQRMAP